MTARPTLRFFLGGADLEMAAVRELAEGAGAAVEDRRLPWGAAASDYEAEIVEALECGERPVLVELADDLPPEIPRDRLILVDHHGERAGAKAPSALRQVFDLLGLPASAWTRRLALIEENDIGHIRALRAMGASSAEIRAIRDADRRAQGVSAVDETAAGKAVAAAQRDGALTVLRLDSAGVGSAAGDFIEPEYGGPGADALLILLPSEAAFYGSGRVVRGLFACFGGWYGGMLPDRGFWGARDVDASVVTATARQLLGPEGDS